MNALKYFFPGLFFYPSRLVPDSIYLRIMYRFHTKKRLNLKNPKRYNEKLQWLKLYNRNPEYMAMVDKILAKDYVSNKIGKEYVIPTIKVWDDAKSIDLKELPASFVLKTNHDSKGVLVCKSVRDAIDADYKKFFAKRLKRNGYWYGREWPYKYVKPKVFAEELIECPEGSLKDYKVMCFGGVPKMIQVHNGRFSNHTQDYYDTEWNYLDIEQGCPPSGIVEDRPVFLDEMLRLSSVLSAGIPHLRVDWYYANGRLFFGELTFFDASGFDEFIPDCYNELVGSWIKLPVDNE